VRSCEDIEDSVPTLHFTRDPGEPDGVAGTDVRDDLEDLSLDVVGKGGKMPACQELLVAERIVKHDKLLYTIVRLYKLHLMTRQPPLDQMHSRPPQKCAPPNTSHINIHQANILGRPSHKQRRMCSIRPVLVSDDGTHRVCASIQEAARFVV